MADDYDYEDCAEADAVDWDRIDLNDPNLDREYENRQNLHRGLATHLAKIVSGLSSMSKTEQAYYRSELETALIESQADLDRLEQIITMRKMIHGR